jgi:hypothetical protein
LALTVQCSVIYLLKTAERVAMIEEVPNLQIQALHRPEATLVAQLHGTPTGFLVDAMGGTGALDYRLHPAIAEQYAF